MLNFPRLPRRGFIAGAALLAVCPAVFADDKVLSTTAGVATNVKIDNFTFNPAILTVPVGTTLTWTNVDDIPHTVVSLAARMRSKPLDTNDSFSFTFKEPGEFAYFCSLHPHMMGKVTVTP